MRAVVFAGGAARVDEVQEPRITEPDDAIVQVSASSICGSDLHLLSGKTPGMRDGAVIGHEFIGVVTEAGSDANIAVGTRVVGSFLIACGDCVHCTARRYNFCVRRRALGLGPVTGDLDGAQAEFVRVPVAGVNLKPLDGSLSAVEDEAALFTGDIMATGFFAAEQGEVSPQDVVVVIGAGPVGLFTALACVRRSARVIVLDQDAGRIAFARDSYGLEAIDISHSEPREVIGEATGGLGADVAFDAVGAAAVLKAATMCVRDGGRVVVVGVYGSERYELPLGVAWIRGLDLRFTGMANIQATWIDALESVVSNELDPTKAITHRLSLDEAETGYELFASKQAMKVVLRP